MGTLVVWEVCIEVDRIGERFLPNPRHPEDARRHLRFIRRIILSIPLHIEFQALCHPRINEPRVSLPPQLMLTLSFMFLLSPSPSFALLFRCWPCCSLVCFFVLCLPVERPLDQYALYHTPSTPPFLHRLYKRESIPGSGHRPPPSWLSASRPPLHASDSLYGFRTTLRRARTRCTYFCAPYRSRHLRS